MLGGCRKRQIDLVEFRGPRGPGLGQRIVKFRGVLRCPKAISVLVKADLNHNLPRLPRGKIKPISLRTRRQPRGIIGTLQKLAKLPEHEWAGRYSTGPGLSGLTLVLAPTAGFTFHHWSDIGDHDLNHGKIKEVLPDRLVLECVIDPKLNDSRMFSDQLLRVPWGKRRYLVPEQGMLEFCNSFNSGGLQYGREPFVLARDGDEKLPVEGMPVVPEQFRKFLLAEPIAGTLREVFPIERGEMPKGMNMEWIKARAAMEPGAKAGVQKGMMFCLVEPSGFKRAEVIAVRDDDCTVEFKDFVMAGEAGIDPKPGWKLSTQSWVSRLKDDPAPAATEPKK